MSAGQSENTLSEALRDLLAWSPTLTSPGYRRAAERARAALAAHREQPPEQHDGMTAATCRERYGDCPHVQPYAAAVPAAHPATDPREVIAALFSGEFDHLTAAEFRERFPAHPATEEPTT